MTKPELVTFIMENTSEYKKTHLMEKYKAELEVIAAAFQHPAEHENAANDELAPEAQKESEKSHAASEVENETVITQPDNEIYSEPATPENAPEDLSVNTPAADSAQAPPAFLPVHDEPSDNIDEHLPPQTNETNEVNEVILMAYEDNKKIAKIRRADKNEFRETVIEKVLEQVTAAGLTEPKAIAELTISIIQTYASDLTTFCPMNNNERKMLETIPLMTEYENAGSKVTGKNFLQKVKELHNIEITASRALMVQLKRKKYIAIEGSKEKYIVLLERGIKHLQKVS